MHPPSCTDFFLSWKGHAFRASRQSRGMNNDNQDRNAAEVGTGAKARKVDPRVFGELVEDPRVSHGAFRLWHCLFKHANPRAEAWPAQRTIARKIGCKPHSLKGWTRELVEAGYLAMDYRGPKRHLLYRLLSGHRTGQPLAPPASSNQASVAPGSVPRAASIPLPVDDPIVAQTGRQIDAQKGNLTNTMEPNPRTKEGLSSTSMILMSKELDRVEAKLNHIRSQYDSHQTWDKNDRAEFRRLRTRRDELLQFLGFAI